MNFPNHFRSIPNASYEQFQITVKISTINAFDERDKLLKNT